MVVGDIEQKPAGIPVLLRQYLRLGGKLLGFNLDPKFANALDGLIVVDLTKTEPKLLDRYGVEGPLRWSDRDLSKSWWRYHRLGTARLD